MAEREDDGRRAMGRRRPGEMIPEEDLEWEMRDELAGLIRQYLYVPDGEPPPRWSVARCLSVAKLMKRYGETEEAIGEAIRGVGILRERGLLGSLARPGEKVTMRIFTTAKSYGIPLYDRARHEVRKREAHRSKAAMTAIGAALRAAAGDD